jgi:catechol 2,3-dioxygenase-like lactoylglutathione lyase family enzyme
MNFSFDHAAQVVPDIAEAVAWYQKLLPNTRVIHQDATWAFIEAGGAKIAFVVKDQHPGHLAWRVDDETLERLAREFGREIKPHRDRTRSFYLEAPGGQAVEIIAYPPDYGQKAAATE